MGQVIDYDAFGYDYRSYWDGRGYEQWAEGRALGRLLPRLGKSNWFIDIGGGFGRNAGHYRERTDHYVLADYSVTNLTNAAELLSADIASGKAFLVRCDVNRLPFVTGAFDTGMVVRVLHHLGEVDHALTEMSRVISDRWLIDVPIKHHLLGMVRGAARRNLRQVRCADPMLISNGDDPLWNFQLASIRQILRRNSWNTRAVASVNNFRGWDRKLSGGLARAVGPAARMAELGVQRAGKGWWGPSQFLLATRGARTPQTAAVGPCPDADPSHSGDLRLASRIACPVCRSGRYWRPELAPCRSCGASYPKTGAHWDFVPAA
jgi:SAM-dependent methyltransferase